MKNMLLVLIVLVALFYVFNKISSDKSEKTDNNSRPVITLSISDLILNPREYDGKRVKVKGKVKVGYNLYLLKFYKIEDKDASIYVLTDITVPKEGNKLTVTGIFNQRFKIGDNYFNAIKED